MQQVIEQLERLRRLGRTSLVLTRLSQAIAGLLAVAVACGIADYFFRLPAWLRLMVGLSVLFTAVVWLGTRLSRALRFKPELSLIAQRLEHRYPQFAGRLASAVAFTCSPDRYAQPQRTGQLAQQSIDELIKLLKGQLLPPMFNAKRLIRFAALAGAVVLGFVGLAVSQPEATKLAAQRWAMPFGEAEWPRRVRLAQPKAPKVWPEDTPLSLRARLEKGYTQGMRVWVNYRLEDVGGRSTAWQRTLMSPQAAAAGSVQDATKEGAYEQIVDLSSLLLSLAGGTPGTAPTPGSPTDRGTLVFYFEGGDDRTQPQSVRLVSRPRLESLRAQVVPPDYAKGAVPKQRLDLHQQAGPTASLAALAGSQVSLRIGLNKPIPLDEAALARSLPGLDKAQDLKLRSGRGPADQKETTPEADEPESQADAAGTDPAEPWIEARFRLDQTFQSPLRLIDKHGLKNVSSQEYRFEAVTDQPPRVSMSQPASDESVLPTAVIELAGQGRDDVAMQWLSLQAKHPARQGPSAEPQVKTVQLSRVEPDRADQTQLSVTHRLELEAWSLQPGDVVSLQTLGKDRFELNGQTHEPVGSSVRKLRIIDQATLIAQIRSELAGVRQQATRLAQWQRELREKPPKEALGPQQQLNRNVSAQKRLAQRLQKRIDRNRLEDSPLRTLLGEVDALLQQAERASDQAAAELQKPQRDTEQARQRTQQRQEQAAAALTELSALLDQGRDALTLQLRLQQMLKIQRGINQDTQELMPKTLGRETEDLKEPLKGELQELQDRQRGTAEQAQELARQMRAAAEKMKQDPQADQATAEALSEAAKTAQRERLDQTMEQAGERISKNRLSAASESQSQARQTLQRMAQQLGEQTQQRRQEMLSRQLAALAEVLQRLIDQQSAQNQRLTGGAEPEGLVQPQSLLRRNTMAAEEQAAATPKTAPVAEPLERASDQQARALKELRRAQAEPADQAQRRALADLEEALASLRELQQQQRQKQQEQRQKQLRELYQELADRQLELREQTEELSQAMPLDRRQRREALELGQGQQELRTKLQEELQPKVADRATFVYLHERIDQAMSRAGGALRQAQPGPGPVEDQSTAAQMLQRMADALERRPEDQPFDRQQAGGGGGGGGGGQQPPAVPPVAELRLLKDLSEQALQEMQRIDQAPDLPADQRSQEVQALTNHLRAISDLGKRLLRNTRAGQPEG